MRFMLRSLAAGMLVLGLGCAVSLAQDSAIAQSQSQSQTQSADPTKPILMAVTRFENNLLSLAQAMPADKYTFAPSAELFKTGAPAQFATVRTFAQQIGHVAGEPFRLLAPYGVTPDATVDVKTFDTLTSKDDLIKALVASFNYQNKVIASIKPDTAFTPQGPRGLSLMAALMAMLNDDGDHYGQMVVYARMNGIIPPATERQLQNTRPATAAAQK
jgi:hypothetical protein